MSNRILPNIVSRDVLFGGDGLVSGTTKIDSNPDLPVARKVRLFDGKTGQLVREAWSDTAGAYAFNNMKRDSQQTWFAISHDHTATYNAAIKDGFSSDPMAAQTPSGTILDPLVVATFDVSALTVLHMHMDGSDNGTTFTDVKGHAATRNGTPVTKTGNKKFGTASALFNGSTDYLSFADTDDWYFTPGDFTVEAQVYLTSFGANESGTNWATICSQDAAGDLGWMFRIYGNVTSWTTIEFLASPNNSNFESGGPASFTFALNTWYHVAFMRVNGTGYTFVNGVLIRSASFNSAYRNCGQTLKIGAYRPGVLNSNWYFPGYIDELRIVKGAGAYPVGGFVPPSAAYADSGVMYDPTGGITPPSSLDYWTSNLLHLDDLTAAKGATPVANGNAVISSAQSKFGGNSLALDGTGDYLALVGSSFGAGPLTVEGWIRITTIASGFAILETRGAAADATGFFFGVSTTGKLQVITNNVTTNGTTTLSPDTWYHVALVRSLGTLRGYLEGAQEFSVANTASLTLTAWRIGHNFNATGTYSAGFIDEFRVTNGVGRYAAAFTPPSVAFTG